MGWTLLPSASMIVYSQRPNFINVILDSKKDMHTMVCPSIENAKLGSHDMATKRKR